MTVGCTIISSAEYCAELVAGLGRSIAKTLEPPFGDQVMPAYVLSRSTALPFAVHFTC